VARITVKHKDIGETLYKEEYHWDEAHELPDSSILLVSEPPSGKYKIYNIYLQKIGSKYHPIFEYESIPEP